MLFPRLPTMRGLMPAIIGHWTYCSALAAIFLVCSSPPLSTQEPDQPVEVKGTAMITADIYDYSSTSSVPITSRRPPSLFRFILTPTVTLGGRVSLPFEIMFSSRETSTITPPIRDPSPAQFLQNAANSFSLSPKFKWGQFYLGSHSPRFSELSAGNVQVFGLGADVRIGDFRVAASAGSTQRAVEADTVALTQGAYARHLYAGMIAYMRDESELSLTIVRARDNPASINEIRSRLIVSPDSSNPDFRDTTTTQHDLMPIPQEGLVATLASRMPLASWAKLGVEVGGGLLTRDLRSAEIGERAEILNSLMMQRTSSRADVAGTVGLDLQFDRWELNLTSLYIGTGYATLAYPFLQADRLEFTAAPTVRVIDSILTMSGTFGHRTNNLAGNNESTTRQILMSVDVDARPTENLTINALYANFGVSTDVTNDTLRIRTTSQSMAVTPTLVVPNDGITHVVSLTLSLDDFDDRNPVTGAQSSNSTTMILGTYSASFIAIPLTTSVTASYLTNALPGGALVVQSASLGIGYSFLMGDIVPGLTATYTASRLPEQTADRQLGLRLSATCRLTPRLRLTLSASNSGYDYGSTHLGGSFRESLLRTALTWQI